MVEGEENIIWRKRNQSYREKENTELTEVINKIHEDHKGPARYRWLDAELAKLGRLALAYACTLPARAQACIHARTTPPRSATPGASSCQTGQNQLWFANIAYIESGCEAYLAAIMD
ncbi:hypothetical protein A5658_04145 [Mycobacterium sp. 1245111.1]|uniref:hypothetical protein n=1 Tax=Mycobacterium sp. 1245111.1 TaxID=1834073 RepID=UPI00080179CD|nr:hypothetical protein [Mycobacterium sp. 1245111.1]OBK37389.1 hypothetical protein A5658_04145 [Mycobacterium sp. 1245111.1]